MTKSKHWFPSNAAFSTLLSLLLCGAAFAADEFSLTKKLAGPAGGVGLQGGEFSLSFAWGEAAAGTTLEFTNGSIESGYFGGRFGAGQTFSVLSSCVGGIPAYFQNGLQIGVTVQAEVQIVFSDPLNPASIPAGLSGMIVQDHMGVAQSQPVSLPWSYDVTGRTLMVRPPGTWLGNTVYQITIAPGITSVNGYALDAATHTVFLTMADPHQPNVITNALGHAGAESPPHTAPASTPSPSIDMGSESLPDYSVFLFNTDALRTPWHVDPALIQEATLKSQSSGGAYQTPVRLIEIAVYTPAGESLSALSHPAQITIPFDGSSPWVGGTPVPVHTSSLALWALDQEHRLWVKIPESVSDGQQITAPITRFSVFALMGSASHPASDVFVFPIPWRPSGPLAGPGPGQTGTEAGGMTFNNLPSECAIKIYTLSGSLVRELHHSDTAGPVAQEKWDGNTSGGSHAASGVYLWHVESAQDSKNGKLMIIR